MAVVKYGAMVTELKGKLGGQVFQGSNASLIIRNNQRKRNPPSSQMFLSSKNVTTVSQAWRSLSDAQRTAYAAAAALWPFTDKYGNTYYGTGYQVHNAQNIALLSIGQPYSADPLGSVAAESVATNLIVFVRGSYFQYDISFNTGLSQIMQVFASAPLSPGHNINNPKVLLVGEWDTSINTTHDCYSNYVALYGVPPLGARIVVKSQIRPVQFPYAYNVLVQSCIAVNP